MIAEALIEGRFYAYRERRARKGKLKVRFAEGPYLELEDYVSTRQIVVPWGERQAFLRDEERDNERWAIRAELWEERRPRR